MKSPHLLETVARVVILLLLLPAAARRTHAAAGDVDLSFDPGSGVNGTVRAIALQPDGNVLLGGAFLTVQGVLRRYVGRLHGDPAPALDIALSDGSVVLSWPERAAGYRLEESPDLGTWTAMTQPTAANGGQFSITVPMTASRKYFRLAWPW